ncbi:MAG: hypothetical protein OXJ64_12420 [Boseongicola sp.]|nr:hypothetical protein [Boseongicola sp.]
MLKALVPSLISSGLAALVGAGVGGLITYYVVVADTRKQLVSNAYDSYLPEAALALTLAQKREITKEDTRRLGKAASVLTIYGSEAVMCRAVNFERSIMEMSSDAQTKYSELAWEMRKETMREELGKAPRACVWPSD